MNVRALARSMIRSPRLRPALRRLGTALRRLELRDEVWYPSGGSLLFDPHTWVIKQTADGVRLWVSLEERSISREILLDRYEPNETAFVRRTVRPGDTVVDAGANIGYYTLLFAHLAGGAGRVVAFEALPYIADALERSIAENPGYGERIELHRLALDERAGSVAIRHAPATINFGGAYLAPAAALPAHHVDETIAATTLDDVVGERACALIKIDVEGAEPRVLRGASATLARARPVVLCELNEPLLQRVSGSGCDDLLAQMRGRGYRASLLRDGRRGAAIERYAGDLVNVVFDPVVT